MGVCRNSKMWTEAVGLGMEAMTAGHCWPSNKFCRSSNSTDASRNPKSLGSWDSAPLGYGRGHASFRTLVTMPSWSLMVKLYGRSVGINIRCAGPLWRARRDRPSNTSHSYVLPCRIGRSRLNGTSALTGIHRKNLTPRIPPFNFFKVTQGRRNR